MTHYYVNRQPVHGPWGGGAHFINACYQHIPRMGHQILNPADFQARPDVLFLVGMDSDGVGISAEQAVFYKLHVNPNAKIIARINENDARKGTNNVDKMLVYFSKYVDATVFVSHWLKDYFQKLGWQCQVNTVIHNGVDPNVFCPQPSQSEQIRIVTHHWSSHVMKGFDFYDKIDQFVGQHPDFKFTYIGRENGTFKHTQIIKPTFGKDLGNKLSQHDVYISASRFDPSPNHVLESLSCNIPTYVHVDGGGSVEFAGKDHVFKTWDELEALLLAKKFINNTAHTLFDWDVCIKKYVDFAESLK